MVMIVPGFFSLSSIIISPPSFDALYIPKEKAH
jgi:hypothetical protein